MVKRKWCISGIVALVLLVVVLVVVIPVVLLVVKPQQQLQQFKNTFLARCEKFNRDDCQNLWREFEKAYVGRNACDVPVEAYDDYISAVNVQPIWNKVMFWSKTKGFVHEYTRNTYFRTLEDILLGNLVDNLTWCGKENSSETFTTGCPEWTQCVNNPVRSFWTRTSEAFAQAACGTVAVMLNGSIEAPFKLNSTFGSVEVKNLNQTLVTNMTVVLVTGQNSVATCSDPSLQLLQTELKSIAYDCKEVTKERIQECAASSVAPCW